MRRNEKLLNGVLKSEHMANILRLEKFTHRIFDPDKIDSGVLYVEQEHTTNNYNFVDFLMHTTFRQKVKYISSSQKADPQNRTRHNASSNIFCMK